MTYDLIKELIKRNYDIDLEKLDSLVYIIKRTDCKTINDWDKINKYLNKYTKFTQKTEENWTMRLTIDTYVRYLKAFEHTDAELFPETDFFYLADRMEISVMNAESEIAKECAKEAFKYVEKNYMKIE